MMTNQIDTKIADRFEAGQSTGETRKVLGYGLCLEELDQETNFVLI
jgi:hypothetical protein